MKNKKGFTLVELLVVIAIIGILSSVAVVNLNSARDKAKIAAVKGSLAGLAAAGEIFANDANSYVGFCASSQVSTATTSAATSAGAGVLTFDCDEAAGGWALDTSLGSLSSGQYYCISNSGSKSGAVAKGATDIVCP